MTHYCGAEGGLLDPHNKDGPTTYEKFRPLKSTLRKSSKRERPLVLEI